MTSTPLMLRSSQVSILTYYICLAGILYGRGVRLFFGHAGAPGCAAEGWYAK